MGLVNLVLNSLINFIETNVESISDCEQQEINTLPSLETTVPQAVEEELTLEEERRGANKEQIELNTLLKVVSKSVK